MKYCVSLFLLCACFFSLPAGSLISFDKKKAAKAFWHIPGKIEKNTFTLKDRGQKRVSAYVRLPVAGDKQYLFTADVSTALMRSGEALVHCYWRNEGVVRPRSFPIRKLGASAPGLQRIEMILTPNDPLKTRELEIRFTLYGKNSGGELKIVSPRLTEYKGKALASGSSVNKADGGKYRFAPGFCAPGVPYVIEKGCGGYIILSRTAQFASAVKLKISLPSSVKLELFLADGVKREMKQFFPSAGGEFSLPAGINWKDSANALLFYPAEGTPEQFTIKLTLESSVKKETVSLPVRIVPAVRMKKPRDFRLWSWSIHPLSRIAAKPGSIAENILKNWQASGFCGSRNPVAGSNWEYFLDFTSAEAPYTIDGDRKLPRAKGVSGGNIGTLLCPSALLKGGADYYAERMKRSSRKALLAQKNILVGVDYEPYASINRYAVTASCFCSECIASFSKRYGLKGLSPRDILKKHEPQWIEFRNGQRAEIIGAMAKGLKKFNPSGRFAVVTKAMPAADEALRYRREFGIDLCAMDRHVDVQMMMNYGKNVYFYLRQERAARLLKKPLWPILDTGWGANHTMEGYYPRRTQLQILAAFFAGIKDAVIGSGLYRMDGSYLAGCKEVMTLISKLETPLKDSVLTEKSPFRAVSQQPEIYSVARKTAKGFMVLVLNNSPGNSCFVTLQGTPEEARSFEIREFAQEKLLSPDGKRIRWKPAELQKGVIFELAPLGFTILEFDAGTGRKLPLVNVARTEEKYRRFCEKMAARFTARRQNGMSIVPQGNKLLVTVPAQKLLIDLQRNGSGCWSSGKKLIAEAVGIDSFVEPHSLFFRDVPLVLTEADFQNDGVVVKMENKVSHYAYDGLVIGKKIKIFRDKKQLQFDITVTPSKECRFFRYRMTHLIAEKKDKKWSGRKTASFEISSAEKSRMYLRKGTPRPEWIYGKPGEFEGNFCELFTPGDSLRVRADFSDDTHGLLFWRRSGDATLELIFEDPYPDKDPHKVKVWKCRHTLTALGAE